MRAVTIVERPDRRSAASRSAIVARVRAEFAEMPCVRLTRPQAQRLFGLPADICDRVLGGLGEGVLACGADEQFGLPQCGAAPGLPL